MKQVKETEIIYVDFKKKEVKGCITVDNKEHTMIIEGEALWVEEMIRKNLEKIEVA